VLAAAHHGELHWSWISSMWIAPFGFALHQRTTASVSQHLLAHACRGAAPWPPLTANALVGATPLLAARTALRRRSADHLVPYMRLAAAVIGLPASVANGLFAGSRVPVEALVTCMGQSPEILSL
jgi:hypothetical protein